LSCLSLFSIVFISEKANEEEIKNIKKINIEIENFIFPPPPEESNFSRAA